MSEENNTQSNPAANAANIVGKLTDLKENNPKVFFGGIAVLVVLLWFFMSGRGDGNLKVAVNVSPGQSVTLLNPNGGKSLIDEAPGSFSVNAEDEKGERNKSFICYSDPGTSAKVVEETMVPTMGGQPLPFVKVEITSGSCQGKSGWTSKTNIKP
ncbi:MAG: hypothetical protein EPN21_01965 [Methylococcaceae bacterium]|nr:MAG: hypothetical protein EPN21_01965 [Methylococcaceae bacterium]